jgi:hypothetical protein
VKRNYIAFAVLGLLAGCGWPSHQRVPTHLYSYSRDQILEAVNAQGFTYSYIDEVRRSANGTTLIVQVERPDRTFLFSLDQDRPTIIEDPSDLRYPKLDDHGNIAAWVDANNRNVTHFSNGTVHTSPIETESSGISCGYYYESAPRLGLARILDPTDPGMRIEYNTDKVIEGLFTKGDRIYIYEVGRSLSWERLLRVFRRNGTSYTQIDTVSLPYDKWVVDIDLWSDSVLLFKSLDKWPSLYYLLDLRTHKITNLRFADLRVALFLAGDIMGNDRLAKYKRDVPDPEQRDQ